MRLILVLRILAVLAAWLWLGPTPAHAGHSLDVARALDGAWIGVDGVSLNVTVQWSELIANGTAALKVPDSELRLSANESAIVYMQGVWAPNAAAEFSAIQGTCRFASEPATGSSTGDALISFGAPHAACTGALLSYSLGAGGYAGTTLRITCLEMTDPGNLIVQMQLNQMLHKITGT